MISQFMLWLKTFVITDEKGQTLAEYALILALIAVVVIVVLGLLGGQIQDIFQQITDGIGGAGEAEPL